MEKTITPIRDAIGKVRDFIVDPPCEGCKRRKKKIKKVVKATRDALRLHPRARKR